MDEVRQVMTTEPDVEAEELDIAVIEDAAYQSLRYDGMPIAPILAGVAIVGGVVLLMTGSKRRV